QPQQLRLQADRPGRREGTATPAGGQGMVPDPQEVRCTPYVGVEISDQVRGEQDRHRLDEVAGTVAAQAWDLIGGASPRIRPLPPPLTSPATRRRSPCRSARSSTGPRTPDGSRPRRARTPVPSGPAACSG